MKKGKNEVKRPLTKTEYTIIVLGTTITLLALFSGAIVVAILLGFGSFLILGYFGNREDKKVSVVNPVSKPIPLPNATMSKDKIVYTVVAGLQYHDFLVGNNRKLLLPIFEDECAEVLLVRDAKNAHSERGTAIKVMLNKCFLGFVSTEDSAEVSEAIDTGKNVRAYISYWNPAEKWYNRLGLKVLIADND